MALNIRPSTSLERKQIFIETLLDLTDNVSKISENSVLSAISAGVAKVSGKAEKDIIIAVSQLFPDTAFGNQLDQVAENFGIGPRMGEQGSSTYVRLSADPGTIYDQTIHKCRSTSGLMFEFEDATITVPTVGWIYAKVRSVDTGSQTNVDPLTISQVVPQPAGHLNCINETIATGGRDEESDELFRIRIKEGANILARGTLSMLEQLFIKVNDKVLRVLHHGIDEASNLVLSIVTQNGMALTQTELDELLDRSSDFFVLTDYKPYGRVKYGVVLRNVEFQPIDISFRLELDASYNQDEVRKQIQINITKYLDFRFFDPVTEKVEWDDLLDIVKDTPGVKYVPDQHFSPRIDVPIDVNRLPRLRGFLMLDLSGSIISNFSGTLSPVYYPNQPDFSLRQTLFQNI